MYNFNPDIMQLDDGATGAPRVAGPRTDTSKISTAEAEVASLQAGRDLGLTEAQLQEGITDASKLTKLPGETNAQFNARVVQAYKDLASKPELTPEEEAAGFKIQFVRTGAGGKGEYRKIRPLNFNVASANAASGGNGFTFDEGDGVEGDGVDGTGFYTASDGKTFTSSDAFTVYQSGLDEKKANKVSAYNLLFDEFDKYGLGTLVSDIKNILVEGSLDPNEFSLKVRGTDAYKARFIANEARLAKGLRALSPAAYIALEDQYQEVMRQYGLPESYYAKTGTGVQEGFRKLIENDVSNIELEDRISTAQKRVLNANPEVTQAIKQFYPDITNADILAYTLDPKNAIENIKRKVTTAEIGGAAIQAGLGYKGDTPEARRARAEELGAAGVTKETAQQGYGTIAGGLQRGSQLASIYGEDPYTQTTAETEVFNIAGAQGARKQRQKITGLEKATFGGQSGISSGALTRDRAGAY
tara:strand:+ start:129 stop:1544 length:1416 start_codon:yes stop_codon:yes gene_type:complete